MFVEGVNFLVKRKEEEIMDRIPNEIRNETFISAKEFKYIIGVIYSLTVVQNRNAGIINEEEIFNIVSLKVVANIDKIIFLYNKKIELSMKKNDYMFSIIHFFKNSTA